MVDDRARGRVVLFGGLGAASTRFNHTWEWNETSWERVMVTGPPAKGLTGFAYDEKRGVTVLFGGDGDGTRAGLLRDTWTFDGHEIARAAHARSQEIAAAGPHGVTLQSVSLP